METLNLKGFKRCDKIWCRGCGVAIIFWVKPNEVGLNLYNAPKIHIIKLENYKQLNTAVKILLSLEDANKLGFTNLYDLPIGGKVWHNLENEEGTVIAKDDQTLTVEYQDGDVAMYHFDGGCYPFNDGLIRTERGFVHTDVREKQ